MNKIKVSLTGASPAVRARPSKPSQRKTKMKKQQRTFEFGFGGRPLTCTVSGRDEIRKAQQLYDSIPEDTQDDAWRTFAAAGYVADPERCEECGAEEPGHYTTCSKAFNRANSI